MKKKSVLKIFFTSLLKSLLCILIIIGVGLASYKISYMILSNDKAGVTTDDNSIEDIIEEATTDEISQNLIYVSDDKNRITHLLLEICNTKTNNMDYVTIPVKTDYTIPSVMYRKLCQVNQEIPQVIRLAKLKQYFDEENDAYGYGVLILEKMLGTDISYFTAIDEETYENHYDEQKVTVVYQGLDVESTPAPDGTMPNAQTTIRTKMNISIFSDAYKRQITDLNHEEDKIVSFIKDQYERVVSNLTVYNKIGYIAAYEKIFVENIHFWGLPGRFTDGVFEVDSKAVKKALKQLTDNMETYTVPQDLTAKNRISAKVNQEIAGQQDAPASTKKPVADSKGLKLYVLNGSQIAGLASATKDRLESQGYAVEKVGNYTQETLTTTRIIVSKKGQGKDLVQYFSNPELIVGDVTAGYDIEIIVGTADAPQ